jgi:N6-L-threonylcarbamoyladenine synthase
LRQVGGRRLVVSGGVGANKRLRASLRIMAAASDAQAFFPRPEFCTDNGAMIAYVGYLRRHQGRQMPCPIEARARWSLEELEPA